MTDDEFVILKVNKKQYRRLKRIYDSYEDRTYREYLDLYFDKDGNLQLCTAMNDYTKDDPFAEGNYVGDITFIEEK